MPIKGDFRFCERKTDMKKIISLVLTVVILSGFIMIPQNAFAYASREEGVISLLKDLKIMQGDENGDMQLDRTVSRAEFAKIAVAASSAKNTVALGLKVSPYRDVRYTEWFAPYVRAAVTAGYVEGYLDSTYRPNNAVKYEEAVTVMLRVLGYSDNAFGAAYPYGQLAQAQGLNMLDDVGGTIGADMTRRQIMYLVYNTLQDYSVGSAFSGMLLGTHDCAMSENQDVIATNAQDSSLGVDKVFTSRGTYTKGDYFNDNSVGATGKLFIKNNRDVVAFVPDTQNGGAEYETYFVYSTLTDSVVGYRNGVFETINVPDSTVVYKNQSATNYAMVKNSLSMGDTMYVKRTGGGSIDYITYSSNTMTGPVRVMSDNWLTNIGGSSSTTVMRDGVRSSAGAVLGNDIIYYSEPLDMVFAYSNKVTGVYENAIPTKDSPSKVVISGVTYDVEGVDAFNNLSSSGTFNYGDTVTICIGKDGGAAGVVTSTNMSNISTSVTGYMTSAGKKTFTDSNNKQYSSYYVEVVSTTGQTSTYETDYDKSSYVGSVVSIKPNGKKTTITKLNGNSGLTGVVSYAGGYIGSHTIAPNVNILDVTNQSVYDTVLYKRVYLQRLDGMTLNASDVLYFASDSMGRVTDIILNDVTGDVYSYGIVTAGTNDNIVNVDIDGTTSRMVSNSAIRGRGPCKILTSGGALRTAMTLNTYNGSISDLDGERAVINNVEYKLSDKVVIYKRSEVTKYQKITLDEAVSGGYGMIAYYDNTESNGGRIRIIVCN